jgi:serine/threonine protein kinase/TolA-binding protein
MAVADITGRTLSHYQVIEKLGEGSSAVVYLAEDLVLGRAVVLKLLPPGRSTDEAASRRFLHEARTASSLNHPNICTIHEIAEHEGQQFIVMERLDGRTLEQTIAGGPLDLGQVLDLAAQIADALDVAHANGIVHRDIKPPNIMVTRRGQAMLLDFGIAVLVQPTQRRVTPESGTGTSSFGRWGGTLAYMSPEQLRGEDLDGRSDLFSLGTVLHEMVTGQPVFRGADPTEIATAILTRSPALLRTIAAATPPELERIVAKALEPNRQLRYQTAADLRADLQRLRRDLDAAPPLPLAISSGARPWRRGPLIAAAVVLFATAATALALVDTQRIRQRLAPAPTPTSVPASAPAVEAAASTALAPVSAPAAAAAPAPALVVDAPATPRQAASVTPERRPDTAKSAPVAARRGAGDDPTTPSATAAHGAATSASVGPSNSDASAPAASEPTPDAAMEQELSVARAQLAHKLDQQAFATLREAVLRNGNSPAAVDAWFLMASIQEKQKPEDAMATYVQIADRFMQHARAPEALFRLAETTRHSRRPNRHTDARTVLIDLVERYPRSAWVVRALVAKADIEEREEIRELDTLLGAPASAALATWRQVAARDDGQAEREMALWKLGTLYEDAKQYDLAVQALTTLAERYPETRHDAWAAVARLYDRRLKNPALARAAWARVPSTSPHFKDAQKRASKP